MVVQAIFIEYRTTSHNNLRFHEGAAWAAFQGLQSLGILVAAHGRMYAKLPVKEMPVVLAVSAEEITQGSQSNEACAASIRDSLNGVAGTQGVQASAF